MNSLAAPAIEEMNQFWQDVGQKLRAQGASAALSVWASTYLPVCTNSHNVVHGQLHEEHISLEQRYNFLQALAPHLQNPDFTTTDTFDALRKTFDTTDVQRLPRLLTLMINVTTMEKPVEYNPVPPWSEDLQILCHSFMERCGFQGITRTPTALPQYTHQLLSQIQKDCETIEEQSGLDPKIFGLGSQLVFASYAERNIGLYSHMGSLILRADEELEVEEHSLTFFHEWMHMIDHIAFTSATSHVSSPLAQVDPLLRQIHKDLIRMPPSVTNTIDPYAEIVRVIKVMCECAQVSSAKEQTIVDQTKELFHTTKSYNKRVEILEEVIRSTIWGDVLPLTLDLRPAIENALDVYVQTSKNLTKFHKQLKDGYSVLYIFSAQKDENRHDKNGWRKWFTRPKKYYSTPQKILARSAEQFFAHQLGRSLLHGMEYPQASEACHTQTLFAPLFNHLKSLQLQPISPEKPKW